MNWDSFVRRSLREPSNIDNTGRRTRWESRVGAKNFKWSFKNIQTYKQEMDDQSPHHHMRSGGRQPTRLARINRAMDQDRSLPANSLGGLAVVLCCWTETMEFVAHRLIPNAFNRLS